MKIEGILPALITPVDQNEKLNVKELERMLEYLIAEGANGFYVLGGTGEGILVPRELHKQMTRETIRLVKGRVPCIVHVARLEYDEMIELARTQGIVILTSPLRMYDACGLLYEAGLHA